MITRSKRVLFMLTVHLLFCIIPPATDRSFAGPTPGKLVFVYTRPKDHEMTRWLTLVYTEALRRLDIAFAFMDVPPRRASELSNRGKVDGELGRIYDYNKKYKNMLRVEEHHTIVRFMAFSVDPHISLNGWESLKGTHFRLSHRNGIKKCETKLPHVVPPERIVKVDTVNQGIKMLSAGRVDLFVGIYGIVFKYLNSNDFKDFPQHRTIHRVGLMEMTTGHAFLHKKHGDLIHKIGTVLKDMKQEGRFEQYRDKIQLSQPLEY